MRSALIATLFALPVGAAAELAPPPGLAIVSATYRGSACEPGTASLTLAADGRALTLAFSQFVAHADGEARLYFDRKTCDAQIVLRVPDGWQFSLERVDYRGHVSMTHDARGVHASSVYLPPSTSGSILSEVAFDGAQVRDYELERSVPPEARVWSSCYGVTRAARIQTTTTVQARGYGKALLTVDALDLAAVQRYGLIWRRCP